MIITITTLPFLFSFQLLHHVTKLRKKRKIFELNGMKNRRGGLFVVDMRCKREFAGISLTVFSLATAQSYAFSYFIGNFRSFSSHFIGNSHLFFPIS